MRPACAVVLSLFLAAASPGRAEAPASPGPASPGLWAATMGTGSQVLDLMARPFRAAWTAAASRIAGAERSFAEHAVAFAGTLRADFARFEGLVGRAGFRITIVTVRPGVIPGIELTLEPAGEISAAEAAKLREDLAAPGGLGGALERAVILALLDIDERVAAIRPAGFRLAEVELALVAIIPELTLNFTREAR